MKIQIRTALTIMVIALSFTATAEMPKYTYACHVITENQNVGVNFVQVNSEEDAYEASEQADAHIDTDGTKEQATAVLQCIRLPGKFNDFTAQQLLDNIPR